MFWEVFISGAGVLPSVSANLIPREGCIRVLAQKRREPAMRKVGLRIVVFKIGVCFLRQN